VAGGRWNTPGKLMVYTAASASLAMLEMLVHLGRNELLREYVLFELTFDDALMTGVDPTILSANWREYPVPHAVQQIGDSWIAQTASAVLRVPSVVVPMEWNICSILCMKTLMRSTSARLSRSGSIRD